MTSNDQQVSDGKKSWPSVLIVSLGALLNLFSLFADENGGALVAIGCSLIAVGLTVAK
jgi:hypothetical protein